MAGSYILVGGAKGIGKSTVMEEVQKRVGMTMLNSGEFFHKHGKNGEKYLMQHLLNSTNLYNQKVKFQNYLKHKFHLNKLSQKLQRWHELEFGDFIKELNKAIKANNKLRVKEGLELIPTLIKKDEFEWLDL